MKKIIFTCITGEYDELRSPEFRNPAWEYIVFSDHPVKIEGWQSYPLACPESLSPIRRARWHKTHARELFGKDALVIWHDGSMSMNVDPDEFIKQNLPRGIHLAGMKHPDRMNVYQEAEAVIRLKKDQPQNVDPQIQKYQREKFPEDFGLTETGILIMRTSDKLEVFLEVWWDEIENGSHRDQLSFDFARWKTGTPINWMNPSIKKEQFSISKHPKRELGKYDVVWVLGKDSKWENNEIRYSIRSFVKFFPELRNIVIVGPLPAFAQEMVHIPWPDNLTLAKDQILIEKLLAACQDERVSKQFVFCSDDKVLLAPTFFHELCGWHTGPVHEVEKPTDWHRSLCHTRDLLLERGLPINDYNTIHAPQPVDKSDFPEIINQFPWRTQPVMGCTLYHNCTQIFRGQKVNNYLRLRAQLNYVELLDALEGKRGLNYNDHSLSDSLMDTLEVLFPDQSKYESFGRFGCAWDEYSGWILAGKDFSKGVDLIRKHTRNKRLIRFFENKGPRTQKILERNLLIISRKWQHMKNG